MLIYSVIYDFHSHTFHSDGALSPLELIRRAAVKGYSAIAVTDHIGPGSLARVIKEVSEDCELASSHWDIVAIPGVELDTRASSGYRRVGKKSQRAGRLVGGGAR